MQASEAKLRKLIEGTNQYVVPLFQRKYSWTRKQWKTLWDDILDQARKEERRPHFFGSIVTTPTKSVPQGVGKYLLIDGQQRLTTVQVFLAAIRDRALELGETKLHDRINGQYLTNAYEEGDERLKVLPTQDDREAFRAVIEKKPIPPSKIGDCHEFFSKLLATRDAGKLELLHVATVDRLSLVSITCDDHDNPHLIFESLNAKGEKLTPADLIRNFILMRVHVHDQKKLWTDHWLPMQQALGDELTEFVRHYLMKEGMILKVADVYFELKDRLNESSTEDVAFFLADLHRLGMTYAKFLHPMMEPDSQIADRLDRLRRLKVTVSYPLLLRIFDARDRDELSREQVVEALDVIESFIIRRAICNYPSNQLKNMLPPAFDSAIALNLDFISALRKQLGGNRCPDDQAFAGALASENHYATADKRIRIRLMLERIERSHGHKEPADLAKAQIEHVLPQTMTPEWERELGEDAAEVAEKWVHTLGNLTLNEL